MKFASYWADSREPAQPENLPNVPDGTHQATVKFVDIRSGGRQKSVTNPTGDYLLLLLQVAGYADLWASVPLHFRGKIEAVIASASLPLPSPGEDFDERALKGRIVTIETINGIGNDGKEYTRVESWKPGPKPLPRDVAEAAPVAKKRTNTPAPAAGGTDDIPF